MAVVVVVEAVVVALGEGEGEDAGEDLPLLDPHHHTGLALLSIPEAVLLLVGHYHPEVEVLAGCNLRLGTHQVRMDCTLLVEVRRVEDRMGRRVEGSPVVDTDLVVGLELVQLLGRAGRAVGLGLGRVGGLLRLRGRFLSRLLDRLADLQGDLVGGLSGGRHLGWHLGVVRRGDLSFCKG